MKGPEQSWGVDKPSYERLADLLGTAREINGKYENNLVEVKKSGLINKQITVNVSAKIHGVLQKIVSWTVDANGTVTAEYPTVSGGQLPFVGFDIDEVLNGLLIE